MSFFETLSKMKINYSCAEELHPSKILNILNATKQEVTIYLDSLAKKKKEETDFSGGSW